MSEEPKFTSAVQDALAEAQKLRLQDIIKQSKFRIYSNF